MYAFIIRQKREKFAIDRNAGKNVPLTDFIRAAMDGKTSPYLARNLGEKLLAQEIQKAKNIPVLLFPAPAHG